jgi:AraC-like DNA-binding protein
MVMQSLGLHPVMIEIGEVEIEEKLSIKKYDTLKEALLREDFELIIDSATILVEKIRTLVIEMIHYSDEVPSINFSDYISKKLQVNYTYLSKFFSKVTSITIEHFIIAHKIEKVKQLLLYNELTLSEIAWKLHYSSTAHLSAQFKKVTGTTPSDFKKSESKHLIPVADL